MLKKLILSVFLLVLTACSSTYVSKTEIISKKETIKLAITTPDKSIYLLGGISHTPPPGRSFQFFSRYAWWGTVLFRCER